MVECPRCQTEVKVATKTWPVTFKKQDVSIVKPKFFLGMFECPKCKTKFRARIQLPEQQTETPKLQDLVETVKRIRSELIQTKKTLHEKISSLETDRGSLMLEIGDMQKDAEFRAEALEDEISQLREEIKSLKELLGSGEEGRD